MDWACGIKGKRYEEANRFSQKVFNQPKVWQSLMNCEGTIGWLPSSGTAQV